jgi:hypothetical protein
MIRPESGILRILGSFNDWRAFAAELLGKTTLAPGKPPIDEATTRISQDVPAIVDVLPVWHKTGDIKNLGAHGRR